MKKIIFFLVIILPAGYLSAGEQCNTSAYVVIESGDCPSGYKELGTVEDTCPSGTKEWGTITEYTISHSDSKGNGTCSI
ncbi:MAG: hypothetical protein LBD94_02465 [Rickettsiales bacterium]|jgi:hypothetical protein|nr:hypothetical protein [Rickettsiales bacterium]